MKDFLEYVLPTYQLSRRGVQCRRVKRYGPYGQTRQIQADWNASWLAELPVKWSGGFSWLVQQQWQEMT